MLLLAPAGTGISPLFNLLQYPLVPAANAQPLLQLLLLLRALGEGL